MHGPKPAVVAALADVGGADFHVGDEAMLAANLTLLEGAGGGAQVIVLGRDASPEAIDEAVAGASGALLSGGGNLSDTWPALVEQRLAFFDATERHHVPLVTGGQTLGPKLTGPLGERVAGHLTRAALVGVREVPSLQLAQALGVSADRLVLQADDAFALDGTPPAEPAVIAATSRPYLAVTLDESYASPLARDGLRDLGAQLALAAKTLGLGVVFVPHLGRLGERVGPDVDAGRALAFHLQLQGVRCEIAPVPTVAEAVWLAQQAAFTVSSRYHPIVFSSAAAVPSVALWRDDYTRAKLSGALAHVGEARWAIASSRAEAGALLPAITTRWEEAAGSRPAARAAAEQLVAQERERASLLVDALHLDSRTAEPPVAPEIGARIRVDSALAAVTVGSITTSIRPTAPSTDDAAEPALGTTPPLPSEVSADLTEAQWDQFSRDGFLHLGRVLDDDAIERLKTRADDLAHHRVVNDRIQLQLDTGGAYEDLPEAVDAFAEGTRMYRKIQGLEFDDEFISLVRTPRFFEACARMYGPQAPLSIFRAMVMNKPAGQGTVLPWHQDGGEIWQLDREPLVTIWVALDPATTANGCMEAVRGSHRLGLLTRFGATVSEEHAAIHCPQEEVVPLEVPAGHAVLMHNWLIHRSGVNPSPVPRRAVTICYVDGRTRQLQTNELLPVVAGTVDPTPSHYVAFLLEQEQALRAAARDSEEYALSLAATLEQVRASQASAEEYALSLAAEREKLEAALAVAARA